MPDKISGSLTGFLQVVLEDLGTWCGISTIRDLKTVTDRIEAEGMSFLTISLSRFGKDLEKGLDQGCIAPDSFSGFKRKGELPIFMGGFLELIFDRETGRLLPVPSVEAIRAVRQFSLMFAKILIPCTPARNEAAIEGYLRSEAAVRIADQWLEEAPYGASAYRRIGRLLWADFLSDVDHQVYAGEILPKHGPGSTADRLGGNAKWDQTEWTERLEEVFPHWEYLIPSPRFLDRLERVRILTPAEERPVKVTLVPKTQLTPRIIAQEPTCMQYMQQGLLGAFERALERNDSARRLIGWRSQVPNQLLALEGSRNGTLATLDLSEASDRVSYEHVRILLENHPHLFRGVDASRSRKARVPGHGVKRLAKFASMGSALCFPIEAMVFTTLVFVGIEQVLNRQLTKDDVRSFLGRVRVYGDDIIVPTDMVHSVISTLTDFGMVVNGNKSFWTGKFRESCGKEYYDGQDVSIVRVRRELPTSRRDEVEKFVSASSLRNQLYHVGLWKSAAYLDDLLGGLIPYPTVSETSPMLGRHSYLGLGKVLRYDPDLHSPLVKGMRITGRSPASVLDDYGALLKCFTNSAIKEKIFPWQTRWSTLEGGKEGPPSVTFGDLPVADVEHLLRSGRAQSLHMKLGWGPA
jgi:hypothetical protein